MEEERICNHKHCDNIVIGRKDKKYCSRNCKNNAKDAREFSTRKLKDRPYIIYKKSYCENCNFIAINSCQLDVDHIDGNKNNNNENNLQTLCANCHRLKTYLNKDWKI